MEAVRTRSGPTNVSGEAKWMHIPIQPLSPHERETILKAQLALRGHELKPELV